MRRREERRLEHTRFRSKRDMSPFHVAGGAHQAATLDGVQLARLRAEHVPFVQVSSRTGRLPWVLKLPAVERGSQVARSPQHPKLHSPGPQAQSPDENEMPQHGALVLALPRELRLWQLPLLTS